MLASELAGSKFGVISLTPSNIQAPWVLFEAGAISSAFEESQVCTLLLGGLKPSDVREPLATFNHTSFEKADMRKLAIDINAGAGDNARDLASLNRSFDKFWEDLEKQVGVAVASGDASLLAPKRSSEEMLDELLDRVRALSRDGTGHRASGIEYKIPTHMHEAYWKIFLEQVQILIPQLRPFLEPGQFIGVYDQKFNISFPEEYRVAHEAKFNVVAARAAMNWAATQAYGTPIDVQISSPFDISALAMYKRLVKAEDPPGFSALVAKPEESNLRTTSE